MTYTITEPEVIDAVKTVTYLRDGKAISGRLKENPDKFDEGGNAVRGDKWFIIYTRTRNIGTVKEPILNTRLDAELVSLIPEDVDRVEVVFLDKMHDYRNRNYHLPLRELKVLPLGDFPISRLYMVIEKPKKISLFTTSERKIAERDSLEKVKKAMEPHIKKYRGTGLDEF